MIASEWLKTRSVPTRAMPWPLAGLIWLAVVGIAPGQREGSSRGKMQALRSIDDSATGSRWLLVCDPVHPAGPGRLVNTPRTHGENPGSVSDQNVAPEVRYIRPPLHLVIRGGDTLIVEDDNGNANARLEAIALGPAAVGSEFQARLKISGASIKVVALASGHAKIATRMVVKQ